MTTPSSPGSTWQRIKELPGRTPLRVKLITAVLALVTAALAVISLAGIAVLSGYLLGQADAKLLPLARYDGPGNVPQAVAQYLATDQKAAGPPGFCVEWLPKSGPVRQVLVEYAAFHNDRPVPGPAVQHGSSWLDAGINHPLTVGSADGSTRWRVVSAPYSFAVAPNSPSVQGTIIVGYDVTNIYRTINELTTIDLIISCLLLIVVAGLGTAVIRSSLRPLTDIERTAEAIAAGDLTRRVPQRDPRTEVGKLGTSLNTMLAHIETSFRARTASEEAARRSEEAARQSAASASRSEDRMRRFVADASHELRTPLTAIRGYAEYYRQRGGVETSSANGAHGPVAPGAASEPASAAQGALTGPDLDHLIQRVEQEATRMGLLVDDMLLLARLDQERPLDFKTVDLLAIAADALHDARVIAPERMITLTVGTPDAALVLGDEVGLRQVVGNLMNNAMTHTPNRTPIDITIRVATLSDGRVPAGPSEPAVVLEVADQGPGLTDEQKEHVFERFYRTDRARSRSAGGTGLGLAIVSAMVTAHHGKVWVDSTPGQGATFGFALPLAPEARFNSA